MFDFGIVEVRRSFPGDCGRDRAAAVVFSGFPPELDYSDVSFAPLGNIVRFSDDPDDWYVMEGNLLLVSVSPYFEIDNSIGWHVDQRGFFCVP